MTSAPTRSLYAPIVWVLFVGGVAFNVLVLSTLWGLEPLAVFKPLVGQGGENELAFNALAVAGLLLVSVVIYAASLDPFRPERPWPLVYLNFLPLALAVGNLFLAATRIGDKPAMGDVALAGLIGVGLPLSVIVFESVASRGLSAAGRFFDDRGWSGPAFFCLKNSLRWRPSVHETARRCGLLLVEMGRYRPAIALLERLTPVPTTEDYEALQALERAYGAEGEGEKALKVIKRQRALRPHARDIDRRLLQQALAVEQWEEAIGILESGRVPMGTESLFLLQELFLKTGNVAQAIAKARQIAEREEPPYERSIALHKDLVAKLPDQTHLLIDLGLLMQRSGASDLMQEGATVLEEALRRDPRRLYLRRHLADYYRTTLQHRRAEAQYQALVDARDPEPETYLRYGELLKAERRDAEACRVYQLMQAACVEDWRAWAEEAACLFRLGDAEGCARALARAEQLAPADHLPELLALKDRLERRRTESGLERLAEEAHRDGSNLERRIEFIGRLLELDRGERAVQECDLLLDEHAELLPQVLGLLREHAGRARSSFRVLDYLADLYYRERRYDEMLDIVLRMAGHAIEPEKFLESGCRRILACAPEHLRTRIALGELYARAERWAELMEVYDPLLTGGSAGATPEIRRQWVQAAATAGRLEDALRVGLEVLDASLEDPEFLVRLIYLAADCGDYQCAYDIFKVAREAHPDHPALDDLERTVADSQKRARMELLQRREAEGALLAAEHFEKAELHREFGQVQHAIVHYQRAAEDADLHDLACAKLAVCLCERKMFELADEFLDPIELTKDNALLHAQLKGLIYRVADVLEAERFRPQAQKYFKRIFRVDASFKDVVARLERLGDV